MDFLSSFTCMYAGFEHGKMTIMCLDIIVLAFLKCSNVFQNNFFFWTELIEFCFNEIIGLQKQHLLWFFNIRSCYYIK